MSCVPRLLLFSVPFFGTVISAHAEHYPNQRPPRPDCHVTHCVPMFDGRRPFRRCFWRCPPQPPKPNCILVGCNDAFENGRSGQRCRWRCPQESPEPEYAAPDDDWDNDTAPQYTPPQQYEPDPDPEPYQPPVQTTPTPRPQIAAVNISPETKRVAVAIISLLVVGGLIAALVEEISSRLALWRHRRDEVMRDTQAAQELNQRVADITRETDRFIKNYRRQQYERGWNDGGDA